MGKGCSARTRIFCEGKALGWCKVKNVYLRWTVSCHL
jgi:hypothetical protein